MRWYETTDKNNPLSCEGEYCCDVPWLKHLANAGMAYYSVTKDSQRWRATFWHGNRGHNINESCKTLLDAQDACIKHFKKMYIEFSVQISKILTGD